MNTWSTLSHLSDQHLLDEVKTLAARERNATAALVAALAEVDARRLYLGEGFSSLFTYCTQILRLSEHAAYGRIEAARAARRFPVVLARLADGSVSLTTVGLLGPLLTPDNQARLLDEARHKSKRDVERLVASLRPQPPVPTAVRKLLSPRPIDPSQSMAGTPSNARVTGDDIPMNLPSAPDAGDARGSSRPAVIRPLAPETYKIQFTMSREMHDRLRQAQDLLRHAVPNGDPAAVFDRALRLLLKELQKTKHAATSRHTNRTEADTTSRRVPAAVKRAVWARDGGQCAFVGTSGRCVERGFLEYHHVVPYAAGGLTTVENTELRCRAHNQHESSLFFGPMMVREARAEWDT